MKGTRFSAHMSRRRLMGIATAVLLGSALTAKQADDAFDYCFWRATGQTQCFHGEVYEKWAWTCCYGIVCEEYEYQWRRTGRSCS